MAKLVGLMDCNNFFVSCERVFRNDLEGVPVVVLSNNDGCVVSRSQEAKDLGIPMGAPRFKFDRLFKEHGVVAFSSNFELYADLSNRVMRTLRTIAYDVEQYSVDEAFFEIPEANAEQRIIWEAGIRLRTLIKKNIGIPVSIGFAPTKTLAKIATDIAKKNPNSGGVCVLSESSDIEMALARHKIGDIWGVGRKFNERLSAMGMKTALDLALCDPSDIRKKFGAQLAKTQMELNCSPCYEALETPPARQQLMHSATLSHPTSSFADLKEAMCSHAAAAAEQLRKENMYASFVTAYIRTSPFIEQSLVYSASLSCPLGKPTSDTGAITHAALRMLQAAFKAGKPINKVGILLSGLSDTTESQLDVFETDHEEKAAKAEKAAKLMEVIDSLNSVGKRQVFFLGQGIKRSWDAEKNFRSPRYTTRWDEIPRVH